MMYRKRLLLQVAASFLFVAASLSVVNAAKYFLRAKQRLDLVAASADGDANKVGNLLTQGADPNSEHIEGSSALWWAVQRGSLPTVQVLLINGANPNSRGQYNPVLEEALSRLSDVEGTPKEQSFKNIVRALVTSGARTSAISDPEYLRLLKIAGVKLKSTKRSHASAPKFLIGHAPRQ